MWLKELSFKWSYDIILGYKNKQENMSSRFATISASIAVITFMIGLGVVNAAQNPYVVATDTVAGQSSYVKATNFDSNAKLILSITKPDGSNVSVTAESDSNGDLNYELSGYHTRLSGEHNIALKQVSEPINQANSLFYVYATDLSKDNSDIATNRAVVAADGKDYAKVSVVAKDKYGNFLKGRGVKAFSYRSEDIISPSIAITDEAGTAEFSIKSYKKGIAGIMVMDVTEDVIIDDRVNISFVDATEYVAEIGGDYEYIGVANAAEFGVLDHFEIEGIPSVVNKNENITFTVKAVDSELLTVEDYTGTIRFSSEGDNSSAVNLPENYKFVGSDLGQHQFSLGLSFAEDGTYKIVVNDLNDKFKTGEATVVVGETVALGDSSGAQAPVITSPAAGTYSQSVQKIGGNAKSGTSIKVFDNNQQIGAVIVGTTGKFSYETGDLSDGAHTFYVVSTDTITSEIVGTSETVDISIDTTSPQIDDIEISPSTEIKAGSVIDVKVYSEENLAQAALIFNYDIIELNASIDDPSIYVGTIQAPAELGVYTISVLLVDELQNEATYDDQATVTVDTEGGSVDLNEDINAEQPLDENIDEEIISDENFPSVVSGLIAYGSDQRVTLVWDAATDNGLIKNYKVYYGMDVQNLDNEVITKDASTTWYVPNLKNGEEYFFSLTAIDDEGNESSVKSEIVSGIPFVLEITNALSQGPVVPLQSDLKPAAYSGPYPDTTPANGPGVLLLFAGSAVAGYFLRKKR